MNQILRTVQNDYQCTFEELLERNNSFTIQERNLQKLAIEMFKVNNGLSIQLISENFHSAKNDYNFSQKQNSRNEKRYNFGSIQN